MRNQHQFAVHGFDSIETLPFSPQEYSKLKFGSDVVAKKFGYDLANAFFEMHKDKLLGKKSVVIPSPYNHVKNAATAMSEHFVNRLNHLLVSNNSDQVEWSVINRKVSYIKDYGFLDKEKRKSLIDGDVFHINKGFIEGKNLICIDDVFITGTHEDKLIEILDKNNIHNQTFFLYFAKYLNGSVGANIEAALNFAGVKDMESFIALTKEKNHHMLVRPIKFLMGQDNKVFNKAIKELPFDFVTDLYHGCLGEGYHKIPEYKDNFKSLSTFIN